MLIGVPYGTFIAVLLLLTTLRSSSCKLFIMLFNRKIHIVIFLFLKSFFFLSHGLGIKYAVIVLNWVWLLQ